MAAYRSPHLGLLTIDDSPSDQLCAHGLKEELGYRVREGLEKEELQFCAHGLKVGGGVIIHTGCRFPSVVNLKTLILLFMTCLPTVG